MVLFFTLYEKPTPATVKARIEFPLLESTPLFLRRYNQIMPTASCANQRWVRNSVADIENIDKTREHEMVLDLLLHRKNGKWGKGAGFPAPLSFNGRCRCSQRLPTTYESPNRYCCSL